MFFCFLICLVFCLLCFLDCGKLDLECAGALVRLALVYSLAKGVYRYTVWRVDVETKSKKKGNGRLYLWVFACEDFKVKRLD